MAPETVLTLLGFVVALLTLTPRTVQLDIQTRLRRVDWFVLGASGLFILALALEDTIVWFVPPLSKWTWNYNLTSNTVGFLTLLIAATFVCVRIIYAPLTRSRLHLFRRLINELAQKQEHANVAYLLSRHFRNLLALRKEEESTDRKNTGTDMISAQMLLAEFLHDPSIVRSLVVAEPAICEDMLDQSIPEIRPFFFQWIAASMATPESPLLRELSGLQRRPFKADQLESEPAYLIDHSRKALRKVLRGARKNPALMPLGDAICYCFQSFVPQINTITNADNLGLSFHIRHPLIGTLKLYRVALAELAFSSYTPSWCDGYDWEPSLIQTIMDDATDRHSSRFSPPIYVADSLADAAQEALFIALARLPTLQSGDSPSYSASPRAAPPFAVPTNVQLLARKVGSICAVCLANSDHFPEWEGQIGLRISLCLDALGTESPGFHEFMYGLVQGGSHSEAQTERISEILSSWLKTDGRDGRANIARVVLDYLERLHQSS